MTAIDIKDEEALNLMREGGKISSLALAEVLRQVKVGVKTLSLDKVIENTILKFGATPSFTTVPGYDFASCININEGIVHGIPSEYVLKKGDLVSIDLGAYYKGFHTDLSYTIEVESSNEQEFLNAGKEALENAIRKCIVGSKLGDVSAAIQAKIESKGYSVSRDLVGHGIGKQLHESPYVPGYGKKGAGILLKEGMVFAVEVIYQKGKPALVEDADGWTLKTKDGSVSALFEHTVAVTRNGPLVLTLP